MSQGPSVVRRGRRRQQAVQQQQARRLRRPGWRPRAWRLRQAQQAPAQPRGNCSERGAGGIHHLAAAQHSAGAAGVFGGGHEAGRRRLIRGLQQQQMLNHAAVRASSVCCPVEQTRSGSASALTTAHGPALCPCFVLTAYVCLLRACVPCSSSTHTHTLVAARHTVSLRHAWP